MKVLGVLVLIVLNIPVYKRLINTFFENTADFYECIRYVLTPNLFSFFRGEYLRDVYSEFKFGLYMIACGVVVFIEYKVIVWIAKFIFY